MFCKNLPCTFVSSIRYFSKSRKFVIKSRRTNDVGIKKRLDILREENRDIDKIDIDEQALDEMESELASGSQMAQAYRDEINRLKKKVDLSIIERKYFHKIHLPNLLTWAEKEQIKQLHKSEPQIWTYDKLSQHFPATADIIKKLVEKDWKIGSKERIIKHDKQVCKNWELVRTGKIKLDPDFMKHIESFSSRENIEHNLKDYDFVKSEIPLPPKGTEFSRIITDYEKNKLKYQQTLQFETNNKQLDKGNKFNSEEPNNLRKETIVENHRLFDGIDRDKSDSDSQNERIPLQLNVYEEAMPVSRHLISNQSKYDRKHITLNELRKNVRETAISEISEYDKAFLEGANKGMDQLIEVNYHEIPVKSIDKFSNSSDIVKIENVKSDNDIIPMKIKIPENSPKGSVYRVKDLYYDTDGRFLYRVPGMK